MELQPGTNVLKTGGPILENHARVGGSIFSRICEMVELSTLKVLCTQSVYGSVFKVCYRHH